MQGNRKPSLTLVVLPVTFDSRLPMGAVQFTFTLDKQDDCRGEKLILGKENVQNLYPIRPIHAPVKLPASVWVKRSRARLNKKFAFDRTKYLNARRKLHLFNDLMDEDDEDEDDDEHAMTGIEYTPTLTAAKTTSIQPTGSNSCVTANITSGLAPFTSPSPNTQGSKPVNAANITSGPAPFTSPSPNTQGSKPVNAAHTQITGVLPTKAGLVATAPQQVNPQGQQVGYASVARLPVASGLIQERTSAQIQALEDYKRASEMVDYQRTGEDLASMALKGKEAAKTVQRDLAAAAAQVKGKTKPVERPPVATITTAIPVMNGSMATTSGSSTTHGKDDGSIRPFARTRRRRTAGAFF